MRKDIDKLERVQRRATRLISEISQLSYEERLQQCRLTTLETRRIRGDQIEVFKIMHGYEGLNKDMFFRIKNDSITRGHSLALVKSHSRLDIRKYTFSQRVVNDWNKLPEECINATSVNMFKGGGWSRKGLNFEWPYFCQYLSELYQIFSSCVLCGYIIN